MKLFNLQLKDNYPMKLTLEIKSPFHDIESSSVKVDLQLIAFIKSLYPTYSKYLESSKAMAFDVLVEKIAEREKASRKKESLSNSNVETLSLA